jgi:hypothetical protein
VTTASPTPADAKHETAHVTIQVGEQEPIPKDVPAGPTRVSQLKQELGAPADSVLWLVHGHTRTQYVDTETIDVEDGMHFEAIPGGGIS